MRYLTGFAAATVAVAFASGAIAGEVKLPKTMAWSAYGLKSSGYAHSVAIGKALKENYGISLRVVPGKNDIARLTPLKNGQVQVTANGVGTYFAQEGVMVFGAPKWGPQPLRIILSSKGKAGLMVGVADDVGIKTLADLKGKRVAWVKSAPALNHNVGAFLAFAGLSWDDVKKVEVGGFSASWKAIQNDQADAAFTITVSGAPKAVAATPRGLAWPATPHNDKAGWDRMLAMAPYMTKNIVSVGTNVDKKNPIEGMAYPYPILTVYAKESNDFAYSLAKGISESYDSFKDGAPGAKGWAMSNQTLEWAVPYHDGAVAYFKEIGKWTDAMQKHNDGLINRQNVMLVAWDAYSKAADKSDKDAYVKGWMRARKKALMAAGMDPIFN
ncbi:MAG: TAXI family TRAP transporter solute-binding subunit [Rhodospirillaceae bacterium]|jgi:uncharacterized protein|nr:TAXI family TRAP transporter solute-binding subunit [Rhodospirillaceae bacterium]MBT6140346.1 TAXI family TRAP transporter solute-binding subunit [Rhodospirillaceae bacterium]